LTVGEEGPCASDRPTADDRAPLRSMPVRPAHPGVIADLREDAVAR